MGKKNSLSLALDALIIQELRASGVPGAVLLVASDAVIVHEKAYGHATAFSFGPLALADPEPMTVGHLFDLGSLTKVFATSFGIMLLLDSGLLKLADPVARFLPGFSRPEKGGITIRALLNHSSGLAAWLPLYYHAGSSAEALRYITAQPLAGPVGSARRYSDLGFMVLAGVIEAVTGQRMDTFLQEQLFGPLGVANTAFSPLTHGFTRIAATSHGNPYEQRMITDPSCGFPCPEQFADFTNWRQYTLRGEVNDANAFSCFQGVAGHAGLFSTAGDLAILAALLLNHGDYQGRRFLKAETIKLFLTRDNFGNGLGWAMDPEILQAPKLPAGSFGHTGFTGTNTLIIPRHNILIILLTNRQHAGLLASGCYPDLKNLRRQVAASVLENLT